MLGYCLLFLVHILVYQFFFLRQGFTVQSRLALNLWPFYVILLSAGITGVNYHAWLDLLVFVQNCFSSSSKSICNNIIVI
jgi:hypothetical protein